MSVDSPLAKHRSQSRSKSGLGYLAVLLRLIPSCTSATESQPPLSTSPAESAQSNKPVKSVDRPDPLLSNMNILALRDLLR